MSTRAAKVPFDARTELRRWLEATPFRAFIVRTHDGRRFRVTDPLFIVLPATKRSEFSIYDHANADSDLRLIDIASIGPLRVRKRLDPVRGITSPKRPRQDACDWIRQWMRYIAPIQNRLAKILHEQLGVPKRRARDIAFHLTDWEYNLYDFGGLIYHPDRYTDREAGQIIVEFLVHAPNHLAAAAKLAVDCPVKDIFGVGAVEPTEKQPRGKTIRKKPTRRGRKHG